MNLQSCLLAAVLFAPGVAWAQASAEPDATQTFLTTPNFPLAGPLPVNKTAQPEDGLRLTPGATNVLHLKFGTHISGANMTTDQSIRETFYMNYIVGNLNETIGEPMDTGQSGTAPFYAVARHYAVGDPNDIHVMQSDGMALRAICSANHTNCTPGNVYGAMVRLPFEFLPGMTIKVRYKSPAGPYSWAPIWLFSGSEISPGPGGNPYRGFNTSESLLQLPVSQHMFEIDLNDNYPRWNDSPPVRTGNQFDFGTPNIYGVQWNTPPYWIYGAQGDGYVYYPRAGPPFVKLPISWSAAFHDLVMSWNGATDTICMFIDGELVTAAYMEYAQAPTYLDGFTGTTDVQAMHLIIGNQAIPSWLPGASGTTENDGMADGWTIVIQEISAWNGTVVEPTLREP